MCQLSAFVFIFTTFQIVAIKKTLELQPFSGSGGKATASD
jgi:hypothetical protein